jgi:hypothetical protein
MAGDASWNDSFFPQSWTAKISVCRGSVTHYVELLCSEFCQRWELQPLKFFGTCSWCPDMYSDYVSLRNSPIAAQPCIAAWGLLWVLTSAPYLFKQR